MVRASGGTGLLVQIHGYEEQYSCCLPTILTLLGRKSDEKHYDYYTTITARPQEAARPAWLQRNSFIVWCQSELPVRRLV